MKTIYIPRENQGASRCNLVSKRVWVRIDRSDPKLTLRDVAERIKEIQREHPDLDVFFDGDEFAICSRPRGEMPEAPPVEAVK